MSMAHITTDHSGPEESTQRWRPTLTQKEAAGIGWSKDDYGEAHLYALMTAEQRQALGTPREHWEPTSSVNDTLTGPFIADGEQELASGLEAEADPALDKSQGLIENVKEDLDKIGEHAQPLISQENGANYSAGAATELVAQYDSKIRADMAAGMDHHRRIYLLFRRLATVMPWLEAAGFLTFVDYYLNVPLWQPWQDWLGWSFAVTVVVVIIFGQTSLVRHAGVSHNHAREAQADGNRGPAEQGFTRRNKYLLATAATAVAITSGMIWRGTAALGDASFSTAALMVFAATVTGLLMPTLAYLVIALDGSAVSRDRDGLTADLDDDLDDYLETVDNSRRDLANVAEIGHTLEDKTFPDICNTTQEVVDAVYDLYGRVRLLIGGLSADPPPNTTKTIGKDAEGNLRGYIGTSIPGSRKVSLGPLFDRYRRLANIESRRADLLAQVDDLPPHPWGNSRTG